MLQTRVIFYQDSPGRVPVVDWLSDLRHRDRRAYVKCTTLIEELARLGHELRRPVADYLRDGIYELRARSGHVNYRVLYCFHGRDAAVLTSGLTKHDRVPPAEVERAIQRKTRFEGNPEAHTYDETAED